MPEELPILSLYERYNLPIPPWELDMDDPIIADWVGRAMEIGAIEAAHRKKPRTHGTHGRR